MYVYIYWYIIVCQCGLHQRPWMRVKLLTVVIVVLAYLLLFQSRRAWWYLRKLSSFNIVVLLLVFSTLYNIYIYPGTLWDRHTACLISIYISIKTYYLRIVIAQIKSLSHYIKLRNNGGLFTYNVYHNIYIMYSVSINGNICTQHGRYDYNLYVLAGVYVLIVVVCIKLIDCIFACVMQKNKITLLAINILLVFFLYRKSGWYIKQYLYYLQYYIEN